MRKILQINSFDLLKNNIIRDRIMRAHGGRSQEFVAVVDQIEAGFLSYEDWSDMSAGFIYEIFVLPEYRQKGIGELLLSYAENHARKLRCTTLCLKPYTLDSQTNQDRLVHWYVKNGYVKKHEEPEKMEKYLSLI